MNETPRSTLTDDVRVRQICSSSKPQLLHEQLTGLARRLGPGAKLPRVAELCQGFTVSSATLNRALGDLERDGLIVRRHGVGIYVADSLCVRRGGRILLVCAPSFFTSTAHSPFWDLLVEGLRERAARHKSAFEIHFAQPCEGGATLVPSLLSEITSGEVAGLISVGLPQEENAWLQEQVPLVAFASGARHLVRIDEVEAVRLGVQALLRRGCKKLELWADAGPTRFSHEAGGRQPLRDILERVWNESLRDAALVSSRFRDLSPVSMVGNGGDKGHLTLQECGFMTAQNLFGNGVASSTKPDGLVVLDDMITRGALVSLGRSKVSVGRDVHIATHCNAGSDALLGFEDQLIRLEFAPTQIAQGLFECLDSLIESKSNVPNIIEIQPTVSEPQI